MNPNMNLSVQALVMAIVYFLLLAIGFYGMIAASQFTVWSTIGFLISLGLGILIVHDTNCLTKGHCNIWSTVRTGLYIFFPTIALITFFISLFKKGGPSVNYYPSSGISTTPVVVTPPPPIVNPEMKR